MKCRLIKVLISPFFAFYLIVALSTYPITGTIYYIITGKDFIDLIGKSIFKFENMCDKDEM